MLIGDAAHATTPNMGQGACQGIEDAVVLAECLKKFSKAEIAFNQFQQKRIKRTHFIVEQSRKMGAVAQLENRVINPVRNTALRMLPTSVFEKQLSKLFDIEFSL